METQQRHQEEKTTKGVHALWKARRAVHKPVATGDIKSTYNAAGLKGTVRRLTGKLMEQNRSQAQTQNNSRNLCMIKSIYNQRRKKLSENVISEHLASHLERSAVGKGVF